MRAVRLSKIPFGGFFYHNAEEASYTPGWQRKKVDPRDAPGATCTSGRVLVKNHPSIKTPEYYSLDSETLVYITEDPEKDKSQWELAEHRAYQ